MKIRYLLSVAALTLLVGGASAGVVQPAAVEIDLTNMIAIGDQVTARTSKNKFEFIGCGIRVFDDGIVAPFSFGFCQASVSENGIIVCTTSSPDLLDALKATSAYAFIDFEWNANFDCTKIGFSTQSFYLPKNVEGNKAK